LGFRKIHLLAGIILLFLLGQTKVFFPEAKAQLTVAEFNVRLEEMEKENAALRQEIEEETLKIPEDKPFSSLDPAIPSPEFGDRSISMEDSAGQISVVESAVSLPQDSASKKKLSEMLQESERMVSVDRKYDSVMLNMAQDDLEAELARYKNWQWSKDSFTFTPYVWFWLTGTHETNRMFAGDYPLWVQNGDQSHTYFDMKSTRLGLNVTAPEMDCLPGVKVTGVFETDFQNNYVLENRGDMELRKAYIQLQNDEFMFLFGQTWELLSPLYPTVLNWGYGSAGGNFGFRRAQVRYDRYFKRNNGRFAVQGCLLTPLTSNFTEADGTVYSGKVGRYPECQLRFERTFGKTDLWDSAMFAVGGKIAEKEYVKVGDEFHRTSWAFTADMKVQFNDRFFVLGEFYVGELLAINCAGIMQDLNPQTREDVGSTGGWFALGWNLTPEVHYSVGYSIDNPWNSKLSKGMKGKNYFIFTNISRDITKSINVGFEYEYFETEYVETNHAHSHIFMICTMVKI